jgi:hypothetical protein
MCIFVLYIFLEHVSGLQWVYFDFSSFLALSLKEFEPTRSRLMDGLRASRAWQNGMLFQVVKALKRLRSIQQNRSQ